MCRAMCGRGAGGSSTPALRVRKQGPARVQLQDPGYAACRKQLARVALALQDLFNVYNFSHCIVSRSIYDGRFLRDLSSHRRRSVRGGRLGLVKGCPHVLHAAWLWPPPATPGSLKPHVEEPLRVCRILNARTSVALCIRGKRKAEHARPCVCSRSPIKALASMQVAPRAACP